jgi:hypothetical protein
VVGEKLNYFAASFAVPVNEANADERHKTPPGSKLNATRSALRRAERVARGQISRKRARELRLVPTPAAIFYQRESFISEQGLEVLDSTYHRRRSKWSKNMATTKQKRAARKNIKKAAKAAKRKRTVAHLPKRTRTALGKEGAKAAKKKR